MEQAVNQFTKGMLLDTSPMVLSSDTLSDCLNGTFVTMNGDEIILLNDMGNRRVDNAFLPDGFEPVGIKEYGGVIYVASYNPITNQSLIGSFPSPLRRFTKSGDNNNSTEIDLNSFETYLVDGRKFLKSDLLLLKLTTDDIISPGDKFLVVDNSSPPNIWSRTDISNLENTINNKITTPKNKKYTLSCGILNSQNSFVNITKDLIRWDNSGNIKANSGNTKYNFNDGYFIPSSFADSSIWNSLSDENFREKELKLKMNTYSGKLVGYPYIRVKLNHPISFGYTFKGYIDDSNSLNKKLILTLTGCLRYNCPDGITGGTGDEIYSKFDEGTYSENELYGFYFDFIGAYISSRRIINANNSIDFNYNTVTPDIGFEVSSSPISSSPVPQELSIIFSKIESNGIATITLIIDPSDLITQSLYIYYTINGSDPTAQENRIEYNSPIEISNTTTIKAVIDLGEGNFSNIFEKTYTKTNGSFSDGSETPGEGGNQNEEPGGGTQEEPGGNQGDNQNDNPSTNVSEYTYGQTGSDYRCSYDKENDIYELIIKKKYTIDHLNGKDTVCGFLGVPVTIENNSKSDLIYLRNLSQTLSLNVNLFGTNLLILTSWGFKKLDNKLKLRYNLDNYFSEELEPCNVQINFTDFTDSSNSELNPQSLTYLNDEIEITSLTDRHFYTVSITYNVRVIDTGIILQTKTISGLWILNTPLFNSCYEKSSSNYVKNYCDRNSLEENIFLELSKVEYEFSGLDSITYTDNITSEHNGSDYLSILNDDFFIHNKNKVLRTYNISNVTVKIKNEENYPSDLFTNISLNAQGSSDRVTISVEGNSELREDKDIQNPTKWQVSSLYNQVSAEVTNDPSAYKVDILYYDYLKGKSDHNDERNIRYLLKPMSEVIDSFVERKFSDKVGFVPIVSTTTTQSGFKKYSCMYYKGEKSVPSYGEVEENSLNDNVYNRTSPVSLGINDFQIGYMNEGRITLSELRSHIQDSATFEPFDYYVIKIYKLDNLDFTNITSDSQYYEYNGNLCRIIYLKASNSGDPIDAIIPFNVLNVTNVQNLSGIKEDLKEILKGMFVNPLIGNVLMCDKENLMTTIYSACNAIQCQNATYTLISSFPFNYNLIVLYHNNSNGLANKYNGYIPFSTDDNQLNVNKTIDLVVYLNSLTEYLNNILSIPTINDALDITTGNPIYNFDSSKVYYKYNGLYDILSGIVTHRDNINSEYFIPLFSSNSQRNKLITFIDNENSVDKYTFTHKLPYIEKIDITHAE